MAESRLSPMMQQYLQIKEQNPDAILFFRLGDFYEMFFDDAKLVSQELELTLTGKDCGLSERAPMCGVPFHAVETYLQKLIEKGYKVAICEQMTDPALSKGLVERQVIRIVTPGTVIESNLLEDRRSNYILSICLRRNQAGCALCDVSTGEFYLYQIADVRVSLSDELARISPSEIIVNDMGAFLRLEPDRRRMVSAPDEASFAYAAASKCMRAHFGQTIEELGFADERIAVCAAGALLKYLTDTQKNALKHIVSAKPYDNQRYMALDRVALRNLELTETSRGKARKGSLLWILDKTRTAMGSRLLRAWIERPLLDAGEICRRQDAVEAFMRNPMSSDALREQLESVYDVERLLSRIAYDAINARDCLALQTTLEAIPELKRAAPEFDAPLIAETLDALDPMPELLDTLHRAISPDAPLSVRDGGMIAPGYSEELDSLRDVSANGKKYLAEMEQKERDETGIKNLKIGYNRVFGYYIEVAKGQLSMVPDYYIRKQTLANGERYITPELKELESEILTARDRITALEYELFTQVRLALAEQAERVQRTARAVACVDVLADFAAVAVKNNYCRPEIDLSGEIEIRDGRHPVVEQMLKGSLFVPNDTRLDTDANRVAILTGPNMAGKSTYMRQVALIVLMAQIGSFVPAKSARIGVVDRIFTRIGASDDLASGKSTFMVEMTEVAEILKNATARSLLILDEIGRGTSTFDGMAIARAVLEYAADRRRLGAKTLFATHYHELTDIERELEGVRNYNIAVKKRGGDIVFLRKIVPGAADDSYGVEVAKLAGLPDRVITRARELLRELESGAPVRTVTVAAPDQLSIASMENDALRRRLESLAVETLTPIEAMNALYELKQML